MKAYASSELFQVDSSQGRTRKVVCRLCGDILFQARADDTESQISAAVVGIKAHFLIQHDITLVAIDCQDPDCTEHLL